MSKKPAILEIVPRKAVTGVAAPHTHQVPTYETALSQF